MRQSLNYVIAVLVVVLGGLLSLGINVATNLLPTSWLWTRNPYFVWPSVGVTVVLLAALSVLQLRRSRRQDDKPAALNFSDSTFSGPTFNMPYGTVHYNQRETDESSDEDRAHQAWNVPSRLRGFIGRDAQLATVREFAREKKEPSLVSIVGMGGVGKTQLAIEYAHRHADDFELVFWVDAAVSSSIPENLKQLCPFLGISPPDDVRLAARAVLNELAIRTHWLLIFDNVESAEVLHEVGLRGPGTVLATSRDIGLARLGNVLNLTVLDRSESTQFLIERLKTNRESSDSLAEVLGDLPLALEQAAAYIDYVGMSVSDYVELWNRNSADLLRRGEVVGYPHTVATTWKISIDRIRQVDEASVEFIDYCSLLSPTPIPLATFSGADDHLSGELARRVGSRAEILNVAAPVVSLSLCRRLADDVVVFHTLVQESHRAGLDEGHVRALLHDLADVFRTFLPSERIHDPVSWPWWWIELPHISVLLERWRSHGVRSEAVGLLLYKSAEYLEEQGQSQQALELATEAIEVVEGTAGRQSRQAAVVLDLIGRVSRERGSLQEALDMQREAVEISEQLNGPVHPSTMVLYGHYALTLSATGNLVEAKKYALKCLDWADDDRQEREDEYVGALRTLGYIEIASGRYDEGYECHRKALALAESQEPRQVLAIASDWNNVSSAAFYLKRFDESLSYSRKALEVYEKLYGPDHPQVGAVTGNMALSFRLLGRTEEARLAANRALEIAERTDGEDSTRTLATLQNLAGQLSSEGDFTAANDLYQRALAVAERTLGRDHRFTAVILSNQAMMHFRKEDYFKARPLVMESIARAERSGAPAVDLARKYSLLGRLQIYLGNLKQARKSLVIARRFFIDTSDANSDELAVVNELLKRLPQ